MTSSFNNSIPFPLKDHHGIRLCCPLGCKNAFLTIRQENEHVKMQHDERSQKYKTGAAKATPQQLLECVSLSQKNRLAASLEEKVTDISRCFNPDRKVDIYQVEPSVVLATARALADNEPGSERVIGALHKRIRSDPRARDLAFSNNDYSKFCIFLENFLPTLTQDGHFVRPAKETDKDSSSNSDNNNNSSSSSSSSQTRPSASGQVSMQQSQPEQDEADDSSSDDRDSEGFTGSSSTPASSDLGDYIMDMECNTTLQAQMQQQTPMQYFPNQPRHMGPEFVQCAAGPGGQLADAGLGTQGNFNTSMITGFWSGEDKPLPHWQIFLGEISDQTMTGGY